MIAQPAANFARQMAAILAMLTIVGCGSQTPEPRRATQPQRVAVPPAQSVGDRAAEIALQQLGIPYRYGGSSRSGFDCSGLVQYSYARAGKSLPRTTGQLWSASQTVVQQEPKKGDLLFFNIEGKMSHVGLYIGDGQFVHAPSSGRTVAVASIETPYYSNALSRVARPR